MQLVDFQENNMYFPTYHFMLVFSLMIQLPGTVTLSIKMASYYLLVHSCNTIQI